MLRKRKIFQKRPTPTTYRRKPLTTRRRKSKAPEIGGALRKLILFLIFGSITYILIFGQIFTLKKITFDQATLLNPNLNESIKEKLTPSLGENIFKLNTEKLSLTILEQFSELEQITIQKKYPNSIKINFQKHPLTANIINESSAVKKTFIINKIGKVIKEDFENPNLPYIHLISDQPLNPAEQIIQPHRLKYIIDSQSAFQERFGINVIQVNYKPIPRELHLITEKDFTIWLDIEVPFEEQLKKLKKATPKLDLHTTPLEYIDLRIAASKGDKIIYKPK